MTDSAEKMREALRSLIRAYVTLLEAGRDRIISLGGTCDAVDYMEAGHTRAQIGRWDDDKYARKPKPFWNYTPFRVSQSMEG